jgi:hypothetical protein
VAACPSAPVAAWSSADLWSRVVANRADFVQEGDGGLYWWILSIHIDVQQAFGSRHPITKRPVSKVVILGQQPARKRHWLRRSKIDQELDNDGFVFAERVLGKSRLGATLGARSRKGAIWKLAQCALDVISDKLQLDI